MRPETDFVLERAAWPALLLEENGAICRANEAARRVFALNPLLAQNLSALLVNGQAAEPGAALAKQAEAGSGRLKFRLPGSDPAEFATRVTRVQREGQQYFVLQLFKESGAALPDASQTAPAKRHEAKPAEESDEPPAGAWPGLDEARWPALILDAKGNIARANSAAETVFGAPTTENIRAIFAGNDADPWAQLVAREAAAEAPVLSCRLKNGHPMTFRVLCCPGGAAGETLAQFFHEQSAAKAPAAAAPAPAAPAKSAGEGAPAPVEANLAHKQKLDCALQLARSVALDFNNALTSILGHSSLLLSKAESTHPWRNSLSEIEKSAAKAAEIANDLAAFSRQEKDVRVQTAGNLNALIERTIEVFQSGRPATISIARQLERKLFTASFDEAKMQQAIIKLFENAVEAIQEKGQLTVQTRNLELSEPTQDRTAKLNAGNYVCVEISDDGAGITDEVMPRIFEPFFTTKGSRHRGLGLAWVYGIVTNHGGGVAVSSRVGAGTAVRVYLPANRKIIRDSSADLADLHGKETILMVDDEDLLLTMGQMVLSSFGYAVMTANSGQKALELIQSSKKKIDLVITDLVMPNMSGRELTEQLLKVAPETKIIWSSGYVRSGNAQEDERYLQKPFTSQDLLRKVKQALSE